MCHADLLLLVQKSKFSPTTTKKHSNHFNVMTQERSVTERVPTYDDVCCLQSVLHDAKTFTFWRNVCGSQNRNTIMLISLDDLNVGVIFIHSSSFTDTGLKIYFLKRVIHLLFCNF